MAVALLAGLTAVFAARDVSSLAVAQHTELTNAIAAAAAAAWERNDNWADADLSPVLDLAVRTGADAQIRSSSGTVVTSSPGYAAQPGPQYNAPIMVRGERVGETGIRFTGRGLASADHALEIDLLRAIAGAAGLAALLAMLTGLGVSRRITRPVEQIIAVTRAVGRGQRTARVGTVTAPGELRELASGVRPDGRHHGPAGAAAPGPGRRRRARASHPARGAAGGTRGAARRDRRAHPGATGFAAR